MLTELRIGNWIMTPDGEKQVSAITQRIWCGLNCYDPEQVLPILLTGALLVSSGAANIYNNNSQYGIGPIDWNTEETKYLDRKVKHCQYVHQMQNLYKATTGQEMEIDMTRGAYAD